MDVARDPDDGNYLGPDVRHYIAEIGAIISSDCAQVGLEPLVRDQEFLLDNC